MKNVWVIALSLAAVHQVAFGQSFVIEEQLQPLPEPIAQVLRDQEGPSKCQYVGKRVNIGVDFVRWVYFATTANACGWGAAVGPIWVVSSAPMPKILLSDGGYSAQLRATGRNGLRDVVTSQATAGTFGERVWRFDGAKYRKAREKFGANAG